MVTCQSDMIKCEFASRGFSGISWIGPFYVMWTSDLCHFSWIFLTLLELNV